MDHDDDLRGTGRAPLGRFRYPDLPAPAARAEDVDGEPARLLSGRVGTWDEAEVIRRGLLDDGFAPADIEVFYTGPAGRHAVTEIGGDASSDAGATRAGTGAAVGGLVGGTAGLAVGAALAATPVVGPVVLTSAAVGAFGGALAGGVATTDDGATKPHTPEHPVARPGGVVVAIRIDREVDAEPRAMARLHAAGAIAIERADGHWKDGRWIDWSAVGPSEQLEPRPGTPQA